MGAYYAPRSDIISYEEFRVVLAKEKDGGFTSRVVASPVGQSPEGIPFAMPFKPREIEQALSSGTQQSLQRSSVAENTLDPVKDLGARLYTALFDSRLQSPFIFRNQPRGWHPPSSTAARGAASARCGRFSTSRPPCLRLISTTKF
jgi:hypothetical protein